MWGYDEHGAVWCQTCNGSINITCPTCHGNTCDCGDCPTCQDPNTECDTCDNTGQLHCPTCETD